VFSLSGPQSTYVTEGPVAARQWDLFMVTVWVTTVIFVIVGAVLAYAQIKFRAKPSNGEKSAPPEQGHGNPFIEMGLIVASVALLVIIAIPTLRDIWYTHDVPEAEKANAMDVTATGYQWWFKFDYEGQTVKNADGTDGATLVTGNELVVPVGKPVRVHLRTVDVIHSFWIPKLAGKVDMMPNRPNFLWFKADKAGYYYGQCAEYCGDSHALMRFRVISLEPAAYEIWLANQKNGARTAPQSAVADAGPLRVEFAGMKNTGRGSTLAGNQEFDANPFLAWQNKQVVPTSENGALIAQGRKLFAGKTCISCHTVRGHEGVGVAGPDLTHVGARSSIAAGVLENSPERMQQWISNPDYFKPGNKMYHGGYIDVETGKAKFTLNNEEIADIVAYLQSLK
jgi:cytochrome c oxidase subunit 2